MPRITPSLWFDKDAEEAANFYASIFPDSRVDSVNRAPADFPGGHKGDAISINWTLSGQPFSAINGGPEFNFTEAISLSIDCADQAEVDHYWNALTAGGGEPGPCGWLKDRFGVSWQVIPRRLPELLNGPDAAGAERAMQAMLQMSKLDVAALEAAYEGEAAPV
jgi:predicted 3-demethylubiquinone-9 3-methyltransferase (glyoxalase superfamily)